MTKIELENLPDLADFKGLSQEEIDMLLAGGLKEDFGLNLMGQYKKIVKRFRRINDRI
jgi:hypothetical protein